MPILSLPPLCVNFIITIFLFIVSSPTLHGADDENYKTCYEKAYDCGHQIKEIGHPFWGKDRPQFCGVQGFNLTCKGNENTTIVIEKQEFRVLHINQSAYSMTIARADLWDTICPEKFINTTLNWNLLDYSSNPLVVNVTLVYDCPRIIDPALYRTLQEWSHFQCQVGAGGQSSNINFFVTESYEWIIPSNCKSRIKVPVFQEALDAFRANNTITVEELVKKGFGVDYHYCETDTTTNQTICFCHNGHQLQMCPGPGMVRVKSFRSDMRERTFSKNVQRFLVFS